MRGQGGGVCEDGGGDVGDDADDLVRDNLLVVRVELFEKGEDGADEVEVAAGAWGGLVLEDVDEEDVDGPGDLVEEVP